MCNPRLLNSFLHMHLNYLEPTLFSGHLFLTFPALSNHLGAASMLKLGAASAIWRPEVADELHRDISLLINMAGEICIFLYTHSQKPLNSLALIEPISNKSTSPQILNKSSKSLNRT